MSLIYPAIDLIEGKCVRLREGDYAQRTVYDSDPFKVACDFVRAGSKWVHIIDLEGAKAGRPIQSGLITAIQKESGATVQTGGGVRTAEDAALLLEQGVYRVLIGSLAMKDPEATAQLIDSAGANRIALALDVRIVDGVPRLTSEGWTVTEKGELWPAVAFFVQRGLKHVLCTDVSKDGKLAGPNLDLYREFRERFPSLDVQASGGVSSLDDIHKLKEIGVAGIVVGKALYEGIFTVEEALAC